MLHKYACFRMSLRPSPSNFLHLLRLLSCKDNKLQRFTDFASLQFELNLKAIQTRTSVIRWQFEQNRKNVLIVQQVTKDQCIHCVAGLLVFSFLPFFSDHKNDFLLLPVTNASDRCTMDSICQEISLATKASNNLFKFQSHLGDLADHDFLGLCWMKRTWIEWSDTGNWNGFWELKGVLHGFVFGRTFGE